MTPLEAAKMLAEKKPILGGSWVRSKGIGLCYYCEEWSDQPHKPDCPIDALPQIVAALGAAVSVMDPGAFTQDDDGICAECGGVVGGSCRPYLCTMAQLRARLRGDSAAGMEWKA